jgi:hypothetical protein
MEKYLNRGGNSGISIFEIGDDYVSVYFKGNSKLYKFSYISAGASHVEKMKVLATNGSGLNGYIKNFVNNKFE